MNTWYFEVILPQSPQLQHSTIESGLVFIRPIQKILSLDPIEAKPSYLLINTVINFASYADEKGTYIQCGQQIQLSELRPHAQWCLFKEYVKALHADSDEEFSIILSKASFLSAE